MTYTKKITNSITIAALPFVFLLLTGMIKGDITYHQKIFKTFLVFVFDLALLLILIFYLLRQKKIIAVKKKYLPYFISYFLFIFFQFAVSFFTNEPSFNREYYLANYIFLIIFAMFFYLYLNDLEQIKTGILLICAFFFVVLIWSLVNFIKAGHFFRADLSFGNPTYFAGYLTGLLSFTFIAPTLFYNSKKSFFKNPISIIAAIAVTSGLFALALNQTKGAIIGSFAGIVFLIIPSLLLMPDRLSQRIKWKIRIPIALLIIIIFIAGPILLIKYQPNFTRQIFDRLIDVFNNPLFILKERFICWESAIKLFIRHPLFGAGLGTVYPASFRYTDKNFFLYTETNSIQHSHSEYLEILGEGGIIGIIAFLALTGFVIVSLFKKIYSKKYRFDFRILALGVNAGLISMLIHQFFSLTLRMSVTMTAFFFLLGLGIFLISYSEKASTTIAPPSSSPPPKIKLDIKSGKKSSKKKGSAPNYKMTHIMMLTITLFIFIGAHMFIPVFRSEMHVKEILPLGSKSISKTNYHLKKAVIINPDNIYAWRLIWYNHFTHGLQRGRRNVDETYFNETKQNLDKINSIIYGYWNIWQDYARLYMMQHKYYDFLGNKNQNSIYLNKSEKALDYALKYINKSLDFDFINTGNHIYKIFILSDINDSKLQEQAVRDYFIVKIYIDFAKPKKIIKEQINIRFGEHTGLEIKKNVRKDSKKKFYFTIAEQDISKIADFCFNTDTIKTSLDFKKRIDQSVEDILAQLVRNI